MKRIIALASVVGLAAAVAAGFLFVSASSAEACPDYTGFHAFIDKEHNSYFSFTLDSMNKPTGSAAFGVLGVGMVNLPTPTFSVHNQHLLSIRYDGKAALETDAKLDLDFGLNQPGSTVQTVSARVIGEVDLDHGTATWARLLDCTRQVQHQSRLGEGRHERNPAVCWRQLASARHTACVSR
jgi:hypothetical protein